MGETQRRRTTVMIRKCVHDQLLCTNVAAEIHLFTHDCVGTRNQPTVFLVKLVTL